MKGYTIGALLMLAMASGGVVAQEINCNQIFMNASEKRICATEALMVFDTKVGELGRRAALHQGSFKSDQRAFRKALKACGGDGGCLADTYNLRIGEGSPPFSRTLTRRPIQAMRSVHVEAKEVQR